MSETPNMDPVYTAFWRVHDTVAEALRLCGFAQTLYPYIPGHPPALALLIALREQMKAVLQEALNQLTAAEPGEKANA